MKSNKKIRILIVDDSMVFREMLRTEVEKDKAIEVVAMASDAFEARDKILEFRPDVMTLDVELPKMSGIEFLKQLLPQYSIPVVVISAAEENVLRAMEVGAVDFVSKPSRANQDTVKAFIREVQLKIKIASMANINTVATVKRVLRENRRSEFHKYDLIAIGASTGGTEALLKIVRDLPESTPPILVVQHMPPVFTKLYAERLNKICKLKVKEASDGDVLRRGEILIAPGDQHIELSKNRSQISVRVFSGEKVNGHKPSVDVMFDSVAERFGKRAIGIILTGMGYDGAKGLLKMKQKGAYTIGQDQSTSVVYGMPMVAYNIGAVTEQLPIEKIESILLSMFG